MWRKEYGIKLINCVYMSDRKFNVMNVILKLVYFGLLNCLIRYLFVVDLFAVQLFSQQQSVIKFILKDSPFHWEYNGRNCWTLSIDSSQRKVTSIIFTCQSSEYCIRFNQNCKIG